MKPLTVVQKAKIRNTLVDPIKFVLHWLGSDDVEHARGHLPGRCSSPRRRLPSRLATVQEKHWLAAQVGALVAGSIHELHRGDNGANQKPSRGPDVGRNP